MNGAAAALLALGAACGLASAVLSLRSPPSGPAAWRIALRAGVGATLALAARVSDSPGLLPLAFGLSAVADGLLAGGAQGRALSAGLTVAVLAAVGWAALFAELGDGVPALGDPLRLGLALAGAAGLLIAAATRWRRVGALRATAALHALALAAMLAAALTLPAAFRWATAGALAVVAAAAVETRRLFAPETAGGGWRAGVAEAADGSLHAAGLLLIAWSFLHG